MRDGGRFGFLRIVIAMAMLSLPHAAMAQAPSPVPVEDDGAPQGPPPPLPDLSDPNARAPELEPSAEDAARIPKTLRSTGSKAGGPANDLNSGGKPPEAPLPQSDLGAVLAGRSLYHGNYCGAGQRGEGLPPVDELDAACMHHDACYDAAGHRSCACDKVLAREAGAVSEQPGVAFEVRRRALSVVEAAGAMGCTAP